jgi:hypothetical protein
MMRFIIVLLPIALLGCGNSDGSSTENVVGQKATHIADRLGADCKAATAPNPKAAKELDQLCSCATQQIRSTIREDDPREVTDQKIDQARMDCLRQVYPNG